MKEVMTQLLGGQLSPHSQEDLDTLTKEYKQFQLVRVKTYSVGSKKERSVTQLGLIYACIALWANNTDNLMLNTPDKAKFALKVALDFRDPNICFVRGDGVVQFQYRSFSFDTLDHMEACNIFERGFDFIAKSMGITKEKLISEAQARMGRRLKNESKVRDS